MCRSRSPPEAVKARAFEPFFTTKESGRGTGLGLATVYGFAKQSLGTVSLDSAPGAGTTITIFLPQVQGDSAETSGPESADIGVPAGLQVLLVEDDPEVRRVVQNFLAAMGCEVVACADAEEALRMLTSDQATDLLLTDILLGAGVRGTELADAAIALRPSLPVLLMSGYAGEVLDEPQGPEVLRKPFTRADLEQAIARALESAQ